MVAVLNKISLWYGTPGSAPGFATLLPDTLPQVLSGEAPGKKQEHEDAEEHPASSLDQHLYAVNLCSQEISQQAEGRVPQGSCHQLIPQEASVLHPGHPGAQRNKRTQLPAKV
jgi:hypothetical protein